jgi:hypothetical protein
MLNTASYPQSAEFLYARYIRHLAWILWIPTAAVLATIGFGLLVGYEAWAGRLTGLGILVAALLFLRQSLQILRLAKHRYSALEDGLHWVDEQEPVQLPWTDIHIIRFSFLTSFFELRDRTGTVRLRVYIGRGGPAGLMAECKRRSGATVQWRLR